jgi:type IV pilus assembly protein PilV
MLGNHAMNMYARRHRSHQRGASLVEILAALVITTIGLLGFAGLQSRALVSTEDGYLRTQANSLAQDIIERMRINGVSPTRQSNAAATPALDSYTDETSWSAGVTAGDCLGADKNCSSAQMADYDIATVRAQVVAMLPEGSMTVRECAVSQVCAYVAWGGEKTADECADEEGMSSGLALQQCVVAQGL